MRKQLQADLILDNLHSRACQRVLGRPDDVSQRGQGVQTLDHHGLALRPVADDCMLSDVQRTRVQLHEQGASRGQRVVCRQVSSCKTQQCTVPAGVQERLLSKAHG